MKAVSTKCAKHLITYQTLLVALIGLLVALVASKPKVIEVKVPTPSDVPPALHLRPSYWVEQGRLKLESQDYKGAIAIFEMADKVSGGTSEDALDLLSLACRLRLDELERLGTSANDGELKSIREMMRLLRPKKPLFEHFDQVQPPAPKSNPEQRKTDVIRRPLTTALLLYSSIPGHSYSFAARAPVQEAVPVDLAYRVIGTGDFNGDGNLVISAPYGSFEGVSGSAFDSLGDGHRIYQYSPSGLLVSTTQYDFLGRARVRTQYWPGFDSDFSIQAKTTLLAGPMGNSYDTHGSLSHITPPSEEPINAKYDTAGSLIQMTTSLDKSVTYVRNHEGTPVTYLYDSLGNRLAEPLQSAFRSAVVWLVLITLSGLIIFISTAPRLRRLIPVTPA